MSTESSEEELEEWERPDYYDVVKILVTLKVPKSFNGVHPWGRKECIEDMMHHLLYEDSTHEGYIEMWDISIEDYQIVD